MSLSNLTAKFSQVPTPGLLLLLAFLMSVPYANTLDVPFIFDDQTNIAENTNIHLESLSWGSLKESLTQNPTPRPLAYLSFALNHWGHGLDVRGYHLTNLLIHFINGCLVFFLSLHILTILCKNDEIRKLEPSTVRGIAFLTAALFLVHPIQIPAVTYIVQRMASLSALFQFAALLSYLQARQASAKRKQGLLFTLCFLCWVLALATKQNALILPFTLLFCEWLLFQRGDIKWLGKAALYSIPIGIMMFAVLYLYKGEKLFRSFEGGYGKRDFTMAERVLTQSRVVIHYLSQVIWPHSSRFVLVYDFPLSKSLIQPWTTLFSFLFLAFSLAGAFLARHRYPLLCLGVFWFLFNHIPESTIMPLELVYEHRNYLPVFGILLFLAHLLVRVSRNHTILLTSSGIVLALLVLSTTIRHQDWQSKFLLWEDNVAKQPTECRAHFNFGLQKAQKDDFEGAIKSFTKAHQLNPHFQMALVRRGSLLKETGELQKALADFTTAIEIAPEKVYREPLYGDAFLERGTILGEAGYYKAALADLTQAIQILPERSHCYFQIGNVYESTKQFHLALENYRKALSLNPNNLETHNNIAWILATCPEPEFHDGNEAVSRALTACELSQWTNYQTLDTLAAAYARQGNFAKAIATQEKCLSLAPEVEHAMLTQRKKRYQAGLPFEM